MFTRSSNGYSQEYEDHGFAETPFIVEHELYESEQEPLHEEPASEALAGPWEFTTPFLRSETTETEQTEATAPEVAALAEFTAELKDHEFREALEQLADEAMEMHGAQIAGEYGDRETRDRAAERLLTDHFEPLAAQTEAMLDRFFERLEGYEAGALNEQEIERIVDEVAPATASTSPASEQFLGGLMRKVGKFVSGAAKLAKSGITLVGKGLAAVGKLALGPLLAPLKKLARFLLQKVVSSALNKLPESLRPIGQRLSEKLFHAIHETHEGEYEEHEQTESEVIPAAASADRLEAEFDVELAQLLLTPDEAEAEYLVSSYGEATAQGEQPSLADLDRARAELADGLGRLSPGESAQPAVEHFLPAVMAILPAAKAAIAMIGRPKVVSFISNLLARLISPLIGADPAKLISPYIAGAGLHLVGLETSQSEPRAVATEALAATVEETLTSLAELPPHVFENETVLEDAVREAFENAAASYFPDSVIKSELRETADRDGMWRRMPAGSDKKRYAKYDQPLPVTITPRVAKTVDTFGTATLHDHMRDHGGFHHDRPVKTNVTLYQALPGTKASTIARAEGFPASQLHPLTPHAAGALLGHNAALGSRATPAAYRASRHKLHVGQRLYRVEPPKGRHHHRHVRPVRSELHINLQKGEIRLWLYLSEPLCQHVSADLAKPNNTAVAFGRLKHLLRRPALALKRALHERHLPPEIHVVSDTPNLEHKVPHWLHHAGAHLAAKIVHWASEHLAQYLRNNAAEFRRVCASHHDGVTLRLTMTKIPGMELLRQISQRKVPSSVSPATWFKGTPAFHVSVRPGYHIKRMSG
jgi:hypothetical protein